MSASRNDIDLGPAPYANDRERKLALGLFREIEALDNAPARMTLISKALAAYRIELATGFAELADNQIRDALAQSMSADLVPMFEGGDDL